MADALLLSFSHTTPPVGPRSHPHFLAHDHPSRWSCYMTNAFTRPTLLVEGVLPQKTLLHIPLYPYCAMFHTSGGNLLLPYPGGSSGLLWQGHPHFSHYFSPRASSALAVGTRQVLCSFSEPVTGW